MELLVWTTDRGRGRERGVVICVQPDAWPWTPKERENQDWQIVPVTDLGEVAPEALLAPQLPDRPMLPNDSRRRLLAPRALRLDLDQLAATGEVRTVLAPYPDFDRV